MNMERFIDNKDGTITDSKTNLVWDKSGSSVRLTFDEAIPYAKKLKLAGRKWRLPEIKELFVLVDHLKFDPAIDDILKCESNFYWSATTYADFTTYAWLVNFTDGNVSSYYKLIANYVRCVSTGL